MIHQKLIGVPPVKRWCVSSCRWIAFRRLSAAWIAARVAEISVFLSPSVAAASAMRSNRSMLLAIEKPSSLVESGASKENINAFFT